MNEITFPSMASILPMLTVVEVAALIQKSPFTVRKLARNHKLPGARRIGNEWRFQRPIIERFATGGIA